MIREPPTVEEDTQQFFFFNFVEFELSGKKQVKICYREEFYRCKTHCMDKICLELSTFKEFATAVQQTVGKRHLSSCGHF